MKSMNYMKAYEIICDEIDYHYQCNYKKEYFDFKSDEHFKLSQISTKMYLFKLDEYKFNMYIPRGKTDSDMRKESKFPKTLQKMFNAIRVLQLLLILPHLNNRAIQKLNIDIKPAILLQMYSEMPKNFKYLLEHLNQLIIRFHPYIESEEERFSLDPTRGSTQDVPLNSLSYDYDDIIGEPTCCFPCSFFKSKKSDTKPLLNKNDHITFNGSIQYSKQEILDSTYCKM